MKALEHYNTGMEFAPSRQSSKTKFFSRGSGRIEMRFSKDKTTNKVYKSIQSTRRELQHMVTTLDKACDDGMCASMARRRRSSP